MTSNEFRLGNLVDTPNGVEEVCTIYLGSFITETCSDEYCKTIPLTEEWLLKPNRTGLVKKLSQHKLAYVVDRFVLTWIEDYKYWYITDYQTDAYLTKIEYVHEWQNFYFSMQTIEYFALTGEELTLKND